MKHIIVDIEIECAEDDSTTELNTSEVVTYVGNELLSVGLSFGWIEDVKLSDEYSQPDYVGTVDEIILRILSEVG